MPHPTTPNVPQITAPTNARPRKVKTLTTAPHGLEGEGFPVRRAFAGVPARDLDPFIHMDQMGEVLYAPGEPKGTPWHPHRGFETFTYLLDGQFLHQDSNGNVGTILPGGTQYMTAGDGILHIETPPEALVMSGGLFHGVQLWINLPKKLKRIAPQYQDLQHHDAAQVTTEDGGVLVRILAGNVDGHRGPGISHTPLTIIHATLTPGAHLLLPWPETFNALVYTLAGQGTVGPEGHPIVSGQLAVLTAGDSIVASAHKKQDGRSENLELFIIGGVPLREKVVAYGPFVMNTRAEILEALDDFHKGNFGHLPPHAIQPYRM